MDARAKPARPDKRRLGGGLTRALKLRPMAGQRVVIRFAAGPAWEHGGPIREQPDWDAHAEYIDDLIEKGTMVMGGPFSDNLGSMSLWEGVDANEARRIIAEDPFIKNGVFVLEEVREWTVFVDELSGSTEAARS
jgi:hypothetical protein